MEMSNVNVNEKVISILATHCYQFEFEDWFQLAEPML